MKAGPATVQDATLRPRLWSPGRGLELELRWPLAVEFPKRPEKERAQHLVPGLDLDRDQRPG